MKFAIPSSIRTPRNGITNPDSLSFPLLDEVTCCREGVSEQLPGWALAYFWLILAESTHTIRQVRFRGTFPRHCSSASPAGHLSLSSNPEFTSVWLGKYHVISCMPSSITIAVGVPTELYSHQRPAVKAETVAKLQA